MIASIPESNPLSFSSLASTLAKERLATSFVEASLTPVGHRFIGSPVLADSSLDIGRVNGGTTHIFPSDKISAMSAAKLEPSASPVVYQTLVSSGAYSVASFVPMANFCCFVRRRHDTLASSSTRADRSSSASFRNPSACFSSIPTWVIAVPRAPSVISWRWLSAPATKASNAPSPITPTTIRIHPTVAMRLAMTEIMGLGARNPVTGSIAPMTRGFISSKTTPSATTAVQINSQTKYACRRECQWFLPAMSIALLTEAGASECDKEMNEAMSLVKSLAVMGAIWLVLIIRVPAKYRSGTLIDSHWEVFAGKRSRMTSSGRHCSSNIEASKRNPVQTITRS